MLIDVAISGDSNVIMKEAKNILKYKDLITEIQQLRNWLLSLNVAVPVLKMIHMKDTQKVQHHQKSLNKSTMWYWMTGG
jgi:hypothetical protein